MMPRRNMLDTYIKHVTARCDKKHVRNIREPSLVETRYRTPQLDLGQPHEVEWHPVKRLPDRAPRYRKKAAGEMSQLSFF
ncbi:hypothetical protein KSC_090580 [Ktedonobacter sp. SOSP1-52]|nr:hypothetical protein KSC_090580 [Ktedonobacter sp. SOSP1-52]